MTGVVLAVAVLAVVLYVALRRARPVGVVLDPWPIVLSRSPSDRFMMMLPEPGEPICGAHPPREVLHELAARGEAITACYYQPHPRLPRIAHVGMIPQRGPIGLWASYTWIEPDPPAPRPTYRLARWRRALIRLAAS